MLRADHRNMADDEKAIRKGYSTGRLMAVIYAAAPAVAFYLEGERTAYFVAFCVVVLFLADLDDRLYDLTIRISRTNELLVDGYEERRTRKAEY